MPPNVAAAARTVQLKYKGINEYIADVSIVKVTVAADPVPEYAADIFELIVPCDVFVPIALTNMQLENAHETLGMLKY